MPEWIPWNEGDPIPEPGLYWVTCPGLGNEPMVAQELLGHYEWREWRYHRVSAYMPRVEGEPEPPLWSGSGGRNDD